MGKGRRRRHSNSGDSRASRDGNLAPRAWRFEDFDDDVLETLSLQLQGAATAARRQSLERQLGDRDWILGQLRQLPAHCLIMLEVLAEVGGLCSLDRLLRQAAARSCGSQEAAEQSLLQLQQSLDRVAEEFSELSRRDATLPLNERRGCSAVLAIRPWEFSVFQQLKRR